MSVVYLAKQSTPVERQVALKVFAFPLANDRDLERFIREQSILEKLDHPGIAKFLEGGRLPTGEGYFAMEYFPGLPINRFCDIERLSPAECIRLVIQVCNIVTYAHQQGIIHRDLKPSNILVARAGDEFEVKVIDFGIAKELHPLFPQIELTRSIQILGTPLYMSPEHLQPETKSVDTRSDLFSIATILVELLCGKAPCDTPRARELGILEIQRMLLSEAPIQLDTTNTERPIDREVQWIIAKGLEKDKNRRYPSVASFADDLERYLKKQPVQAGPPSGIYLLSKLVARHRVATLALLITSITLVLSTIVSLHQSHQAQISKETAERELYYAEMKLASDAAWEGDVAYAKRILDRNNPVHHPRKWVGMEWHFLNASLQRKPIKSRNCGKRVVHASLSPDKRFLIVLPDNFQIQIWDPNSFEPLLIHEEQTFQLKIAWHPTLPRFAVSGRDNKIRVFDITQEQDTPKVNLNLLKSFAAHEDNITDVTYSPDGRYLLSGSDDDMICTWDTTNWERIQQTQSYSYGVNSLAVSPDGKRLVSGGRDGTVKLFEFPKVKLLEFWNPIANRIQTITVNPTSQWLAGGDIRGGVTLQELSGKKRAAHVSLLDGIEQIVALTGGNKIATADRGGNLSIHQVTTDGVVLDLVSNPLDHWQVGSARITTLCQLSESVLIAGDRNGDITQWPIERPSSHQIVNEGKSTLLLNSHHRISESEILILCQNKNQVFYCDLSKAKRAVSPMQFDFKISSIASSEQKQYVYLVGHKKLEVWDYRKREKVASWQTQGGNISLAVSPSGELVLVGNDRDKDCLLQCFQLGNEKPIFEMPVADGKRAKFLNEHEFAVVRLNDLHIFSTTDISEATTPRLVLSGHDSSLADYCLFDKDKLITVSNDRSMKIWSSRTGKLISTQEADSNQILCLKLNKDQTRLITGAIHGRIKLWDTSGIPFRELLRLPVEKEGVTIAEFAMDDEIITVRTTYQRIVCFDSRVASVDN